MALGVVLPDVLELRRLAKRGHVPVQRAQPAVDGRVPRADVAHVALEVLHVHGVEAHDGRVQPDVGLGDGRAEVERRRVVLGSLFRGQVGLDPVQGREERRDGSLVGFLRRGEAGLVDPVVDVVVGPVVGGFDLGAEVRREEVDLSVLFWEEVVEFIVEHADDFGALMAFCQ